MSIPPQQALGQSDAFLEFSEALSRAAPIDRPVIITGERGSGKELAAARLHYLSGRWEGTLVVLNCAALSPELMESELFGHEAGAFTGAVARRPGRFEAAHNGTLFLDEIGNMPLTAQEKILRAVEYGVFERVGGTRPVRVDVRVIAATNADLPTLTREGRFKPDLLDRLSFEVLRLPPLREREGDVMLLAEHFASRMYVELGHSGSPEFGPAAREAIESHHWPGNVRELKNVVERSVYRADGGPVTEVDLDPFDAGTAAPPRPDAAKDSRIPEGGLPRAVEALKVRLAGQALEAADGSQAEAARLLGLTYDQFRGIYRKHKHALERR
jgi:psp operon transcriptional activator